MSQTQLAPFSEEAEATKERENCDYSPKIDRQLASKGEATRKVRIYFDGVFDCLNSAMACQLREAKNAFPNVYLIVGVCNDKLTSQHKCKPFQTETERYDALRNCRYVDEVHPNAPWIITEEFLTKWKIDLVAHDETPYPCGKIPDIYQLPKAMGIFLSIKKADTSGSNLISRIVKDFEEYLCKNRGRGYTTKELGVLFMIKRK